MIMPIFNALEEMNPSLISASRDLGASSAETFRRVIFPLSLNGVKSGVHSNAKLGHGFNNWCDFNCCHVYCDVADG